MFTTKIDYISRLRKFIDIVKVMKCDKIAVIQRKVYGMDIDKTIFVELKGIHIDDIPFPFDFIIDYKEVKNVLKSDNVEYQFNMNGDIILVSKEGISSIPTKYSQWIDVMVSAISFKEAAMQTPLSYNDDKFHKSDIYKRYFALKATDGVIKETLNDYSFILFGKMLPTNKSDKVSLKIYDSDEHLWTVQYIIHKPKNIQLEVWIKYLKIQ